MKNFTIKNESMLDTQIKDFCTRYNTPYSYDDVVRWEETLNDWFQDGYIECADVVVKNSKIVTSVTVPNVSGIGGRIESHIYNAIAANKNEMGIGNLRDQNPNGEMKFPDYEWDDIYIDSKAVKCDELSKTDNYSKNYSNSLGDRAEVTEVISKFMDSGKLDKRSSALIVLSYYTVDDNKIYWLKIKVVPFLFYISTYKDEHDFSIKQFSEGTTVKNANVQGRLSIDTTDETSQCYINKLFRTAMNIRKRNGIEIEPELDSN